MARTPSLTPDEARALHREALVIDTQQPPIVGGALFTPAMKRALEECVPPRLIVRGSV